MSDTQPPKVLSGKDLRQALADTTTRIFGIPFTINNMAMFKVVPAPKEGDTPDPPKTCKISHIFLVLFVMFLAGLAVASIVVGGIPLYRCQTIMLLDVWLIAHGVSALGTMVGLLVWSSKMSTGKFVNGPKIFAILLISLNFIWLIIGNILITCAYVECDNPTFLGTVSCRSGFLHFALVVMIIFDIAYIAFFVLLCIACNSDDGVEGWTHPALGETGCCARPNFFASLYCSYETPTWQEWTIVIALVCYTLLAVTAIALGAAFINECINTLWVPYWLIVHGVVTVVTFCTFLCCLGFPSWVEMSWDRTNFIAFLPVLILMLFHLVWLTFGNVRAAEFRVQNCPADKNCNDGLQVFTLILIFLLDVPFLVIIYIGIVLFILMTLLIIYSSCYTCCHKVDKDTAPEEEDEEEKEEEKEEKEEDATSDSSDTE